MKVMQTVIQIALIQVFIVAFICAMILGAPILAGILSFIGATWLVLQIG